MLAGVFILAQDIRPQLRFIWHCFICPIGTADQRTRLDKFYEGQADVYDATRSGLLRGRNTMLTLAAGHIRTMRKDISKQRLIWVDIGGGTGHNIELMDKHIPIKSFDAIYLVDLCEPLLQVARQRFSKRGWTNITVLCQDATEFSLPEWSDSNPKGSVGFVTLSYSLSMMPNFYTLLDRIDYVLSPENGLLGVVDFYTSGRQPSLHEKAIGGTSKECGWISRWFWQIWFDFDHVSLSPHRRDYLEYKFGTIKSYNGRNRFVLPFIVRIPYYIWLGRSRSCDVSPFCHAFEVEGGNMIGNCSPTPNAVVKESEMVPPLEIGDPMLPVPVEPSNAAATVIDITPPLSSFHYQVGKPWRLPYYEQPVHKDFRTFIYSFTWEDPVVDLKHLDLSTDDSMLVITSAGDNALHYAIAAQPKRIHCVDMNPCQGHLLELKLASIQSLEYKDFFDMFGSGCHPQFRGLLDSKISPFLSSAAYQFWHINDNAFSSAFYLNGYSGWALRLAQYIFSFVGVSQDVEALCSAESIPEQEKIWKEKLRPVLLNPIVVALLKNPIFCWNALGVPLNQRRMLLEEGTIYEFVRDTFDPLPSTYSFKDGAYFYLLALLGHYTRSSCPEYLTQSGFDALKSDNGKAMEAFRLHTDSIVNVLRGLTTWSLTRAVIMDHLDWFTPGSKDVDDEIDEFYRVLAPGGFVLWRSAARKPWYNEVFEKKGFKLTALGVRSGPEVPLDRVNMYASFWKAVKT
ncbi:hypothetical protein SERLA73DRAFT_121865 [Serpula lacrymans var. lacrymans S7.3]|uniref:Methyltransferase domain-containing protein n=2 Tax=Serpula lacrymans var. lacrymans TaxID=341189 RepID=F8PV56_SERL3|nr:uncharacterized protein SERLADRAFT_368720 [Serpula lacrymans var. lacrymans S7.9]EGN99748.1 hypothetical protein SERLA73DRAFT_121865 [Serpula lacrymans var. lacrymans S7.3]EGO25321.1 hypothetical protein SERLADRAFT_368720 [Serpula lacrymans var. lacrymans S7.9]